MKDTEIPNDGISIFNNKVNVGKDNEKAWQLCFIKNRSTQLNCVLICLLFTF